MSWHDREDNNKALPELMLTHRAINQVNILYHISLCVSMCSGRICKEHGWLFISFHLRTTVIWVEKRNAETWMIIVKQINLTSTCRIRMSANLITNKGQGWGRDPRPEETSKGLKSLRKQKAGVHRHKSTHLGNACICGSKVAKDVLRTGFWPWWPLWYRPVIAATREAETGGSQV